MTTERVGSALVATIERESSGNAISREVVDYNAAWRMKGRLMALIQGRRPLRL